MSSRVFFRRGPIIVVKSYKRKKLYYTVVNIDKGTHCHVDGNNQRAAIMICVNARRNQVPERYPDWMKYCIKRLLGEVKE